MIQRYRIEESILNFDYLDDSKALTLLYASLPLLSDRDAEILDYKAKDLTKFKPSRKDYEISFAFRVITAKYYEKSNRFRDAIFSYDKASQNALSLGFPHSALRCCFRSAQNYLKIIRGCEDRRLIFNLELECTKFVGGRIFAAIDLTDGKKKTDNIKDEDLDKMNNGNLL